MATYGCVTTPDMESYSNVGGIWKPWSGPEVHVAGGWKGLPEAYVHVAGGWKLVHLAAAPILTGSAGTPNVDDHQILTPGPALAGWTFATTGDLTRVTGDAWNQPEWYGQTGDTTHQAPDQTYYIRATLDSGTAPSAGPTLGSWFALTTEREWSWTRGTVGVTSGVLQIDIAADAGGTDIVATGYYRGRAEVFV